MPNIIHQEFTVPLSAGFVPVVKVGDLVAVDQLLAQKNSKQEKVINIAEHLKIPLKKVKKVLKKKPGDPVRKGDILAEKKSLFGFNNAAVISNIEGIVFRYERSTGNLAIRIDATPAASENVISPVAGTIALCDNGQIVISIPEDSDTIQVENDDQIGELKAGIGDSGEGEVFILEESFFDDNVDSMLYDLDSSATGKIVLGGVFSRDILMKGIGIGVTGFLGTKIRQEDLDFFAQKQTKIPIIQVDEDTLERLRAWEGRKMSIKGDDKTLSLLLA